MSSNPAQTRPPQVRLAPFYALTEDERQRESSCNSLGRIPADYIVTQLEALTMIYHYCLLDSASQVSASFSSSTATAASVADPAAAQAGASSEILSNLLHVFLSNTDTKSLATRSLGLSSSVDTLAIARKYLLADLPRTVNMVAIIWGYLGSSSSSSSSRDGLSVLAGSPRTVRAQLLDLISPIAHHHPVHFLCAVGVAWQERRSAQSPGMLRHPLPSCSADQRVLVELAAAVKSMPVSVMVTTARQVLKAPPNVKGSKLNVDVSVLQFFYAFLEQAPVAVVKESWEGRVYK